MKVKKNWNSNKSTSGINEITEEKVQNNNTLLFLESGAVPGVSTPCHSRITHRLNLHFNNPAEVTKMYVIEYAIVYR